MKLQEISGRLFCGDCFGGFKLCGEAGPGGILFQCEDCIHISEKVLQLEDKAIREAMIALGWTPPKCGLEEAFDELEDIGKQWTECDATESDIY